jgi:hypothetical protein
MMIIVTINYSPGAYEYDIHRNRRIEFAEAFGGKKTLCATVTIKCTKGVPDTVSHSPKLFTV